VLFLDLEAAADQREDDYKYQALPCWKQVWPKSLDIATRQIAESITQQIIAVEQLLLLVCDELLKSPTSHRLANMISHDSVGRDICDCVGLSSLRKFILKNPEPRGPGNGCLGPLAPKSLWKVPDP